MPRVLFVCTGNICRSPAAQTLLERRLNREGLTDWAVESAGTWTVAGRPASRYIVELMAERGLDVSHHRSRVVKRHLIEQADLVLVMARGHAEALRLEFPDQAGKIYLLSEMRNHHRYDVEDPYGRSFEEYEKRVNEIERLINAGFDRIRSLAEQHAK